MPPKYTIYNKKYSITDNPGENFEGHWATVLKINNCSLSRFQYRKNPMKAWLSMVFDTEKVWVWDNQTATDNIGAGENANEYPQNIYFAENQKTFISEEKSEKSINQNLPIHVVNRSKLIIFFKPESTVTINGVTYKNDGAYPIDAHSVSNVPIDGLNINGIVYKITDGYNFINIAPDGTFETN